MSGRKNIKRAFALAASVVTGKPHRSYKIYAGTIELHWETAGEHRRALHDPWTLSDAVETGRKRGEDMSFEAEALDAYHKWEAEGHARRMKAREDRANKHAGRIKAVARCRRLAGTVNACP